MRVPEYFMVERLSMLGILFLEQTFFIIDSAMAGDAIRPGILLEDELPPLLLLSRKLAYLD